MVQEALAPIDPVSIDVDEAQKLVTVYVEDDKAAAKAKGRKGQNVRLTARLISDPNERWDVRVEAREGENSAHEQVQEAAAQLAQALQIGDELAKCMVEAGFTRVQDLVTWDVQKEDLVDTLGITEEQAEHILFTAKNA